MTDLISREDTIREIVKRSATDFMDVEAIATVIHIVNQMPSVEERPKGRWIDYRASNGILCYKCSECKTTYGFLKTPFCPNCGADMRGEHDG